MRGAVTINPAERNQHVTVSGKAPEVEYGPAE
jgi:hypothetical protein